MCNPVALLPAEIRNDAGAVADHFLRLLYPGAGAGNLAPARQAAVSFLDDGSADTATTYRTTKFVSLPATSASYAERVRGLVAMLMSQQRFHQQ
jgi:ABC-type transport system involved in cytochrome bd biosynthesis fused ATPase/permease subunit